ncbi:S41 family peptidase [Mycoplasma sp. 527]
MKKQGKYKLLASLPLSIVGIAPIAILSVSCQSGEQDKLTQELIKKEQQLSKEQVEKDKATNQLNWAKEQLPKKDLEIKKLKGELEKVTPQNDDKKSFRDQKYNFKNYNAEYTVNETNEAEAFFIKDDKSKTPYIDLDQFISILDGLFDQNQLSSYVEKDKNTKTYFTKNPDGTISNKLIIDWAKNTIQLTSTNFFYEIFKPQQLTDGEQFLKTEYELSRIKGDEGKLINFDLGKYNMDILYSNDKVLLPFSIFNTLFMSTTSNNIYFNGKTFTNVSDGLDAFETANEELRERIRKNGDLNGNKATKEEREANFNHLSFTMDYFYGLREYKQIKSFADYISKEDKEKLLSTDPEIYNKAYINIFHKQLNDLHTNLNTFSYREKKWDADIFKSLTRNDFGQKLLNEQDTLRKLTKLFKERFHKDVEDIDTKDLIRYHGNTAIVTLLEFKDGTKDEISDKDNAWKYDTYFLMRHLIEEVKKNPEIKNIVLDLSLNGGGSVSAMVRTLGFMTDKPILNREQDILNRTNSLSKSEVDTDGDGKYENDAYDKYNWNLLVGVTTFSAANQLASIVKEMGIAKIIGQKSGGGMSAIMSNVMPDGTTITMSGPNNAVFGIENKEIESGVPTDITIEYKDFYNDEAIDKALTSANSKQN